MFEPPIDADRLVGLFEQFQQEFSFLRVRVDFLLIFGRNVALGELQQPKEADGTIRSDCRIDLFKAFAGLQRGINTSGINLLLDLGDRLLLHLPVDLHPSRAQ